MIPPCLQPLRKIQQLANLYLIQPALPELKRSYRIRGTAVVKAPSELLYFSPATKAEAIISIRSARLVSLPDPESIMMRSGRDLQRRTHQAQTNAGQEPIGPCKRPETAPRMRRSFGSCF